MDGNDIQAFFYCFDHGPGRRVLAYLRDKAESTHLDPEDPNPLIAFAAHSQLQQLKFIDHVLSEHKGGPNSNANRDHPDED